MNNGTELNGRPYALKSCSVLSWISSTAILYHFRPTPLCIVWCWGDGHLIPPTATAYHIRDIVSVVGSPPPQLSQCPVCSGSGSVRGHPSSSPPSPYTPILGSPAAPTCLEIKSDTSVVILRRGDIPMRYQSNSILCLALGRKQPLHQVQSKLWSLDPQPLMVPVYEALSYHPLLVGRL